MAMRKWNWKTFSGICAGFGLGHLTRGLSKGFDPDDTFKVVLFGCLSVVSYLVGRSQQKRELDDLPRPLERKQGVDPAGQLDPPGPK
jgi:hypothetical protein